MPFIIVKHVKRSTGLVVPVILLDSSHEVLEFDAKDEADALAQLLELNSDSGHTYEVKSTSDKKDPSANISERLEARKAVAEARDIMESFDACGGMTVGFDNGTYELTAEQMVAIAKALYLADCII